MPWTIRSGSFSCFRYLTTAGTMAASGVSSNCFSTAARTLGSGSASNLTRAAAACLAADVLQAAEADLAHQGIGVGEQLQQQRLVLAAGQLGEFLGGLAALPRIAVSQPFQAARPTQHQRVGGRQPIAEDQQPPAVLVGRGLLQAGVNLRQQGGAPARPSAGGWRRPPPRRHGASARSAGGRRTVAPPRGASAAPCSPPPRAASIYPARRGVRG